MEKINEMWDWLIELEIATEEELELVTNINGYNIENLNDVLYVRTGYHSREQYEDAE